MGNQASSNTRRNSGCRRRTWLGTIVHVGDPRDVPINKPPSPLPLGPALEGICVADREGEGASFSRPWAQRIRAECSLHCRAVPAPVSKLKRLEDSAAFEV